MLKGHFKRNTFILFESVNEVRVEHHWKSTWKLAGLYKSISPSPKLQGKESSRERKNSNNERVDEWDAVELLSSVPIPLWELL